MSHDLTPLGVVLFSIASAISGELINWILVYRTSSYRALKENLSRHAKKLEEAKSSGSGSKNIKKLEARLDTWKTEASSRVAGINMRTGLITVAVVMLSFRLVSQLFGDAPAATLPFHPPPFLQKLTHRGLTDADPRQCSAMFIFILCQGSIKVLVTKLLALGPGREWVIIKPNTLMGLSDKK
ncbi:hypothetical protein ACKKBG_A36585 [Auxenochlorella protothecoides x Auxenochlorella symbiontica]